LGIGTLAFAEYTVGGGRREQGGGTREVRGARVVTFEVGLPLFCLLSTLSSRH
jgi:hypothetical protein